MAFFSTKFNSFGLDISDGTLKLVECDKSFKGTAVKAWGVSKLDPELIENGEIRDTKKVAMEIKKLVKEARGKVGTNYVVSVLPESKTFIKLLKLKKPKTRGKLSNDQIQSLINNELPNHIPVEIEDLQYDFQLIGKSDETLKILVGAVQKDIVKQYVEALSFAELKITALEIEAQSIVRAIFKDHKITKPIFHNLPTRKNKKHKTNNNQLTIIVDLGANRSSLIFWHRKAIQFTSTLEISGNRITKKIAKKLNMSHEKAEKAKHVCGLDNKKAKGEIANLILEPFDNLLDEINKNINYYKRTTPIDLKETKILLAGGGSNLTGLTEFIKQKTKAQVELANPLTNLNLEKNIIPTKHIAGLTSAIGLSLRHIIEDI
ncbi:MAG: type IV pilus assembly protein PilM [Patescibacteria group bacterium]